MDLPTTLEDCHRMIRELSEENAALRRSGEDFGHLAERLNGALQQLRQGRPFGGRSGDPGASGGRTGSGRPATPAPIGKPRMANSHAGLR